MNPKEVATTITNINHKIITNGNIFNKINNYLILDYAILLQGNPYIDKVKLITTSYQHIFKGITILDDDKINHINNNLTKISYDIWKQQLQTIICPETTITLNNNNHQDNELKKIKMTHWLIIINNIEVLSNKSTDFLETLLTISNNRELNINIIITSNKDANDYVLATKIKVFLYPLNVAHYTFDQKLVILNDVILPNLIAKNPFYPLITVNNLSKETINAYFNNNTNFIALSNSIEKTVSELLWQQENSPVPKFKAIFKNILSDKNLTLIKGQALAINEFDHHLQNIMRKYLKCDCFNELKSNITTLYHECMPTTINKNVKTIINNLQQPLSKIITTANFLTKIMAISPAEESKLIMLANVIYTIIRTNINLEQKIAKTNIATLTKNDQLLVNCYKMAQMIIAHSNIDIIAKKAYQDIKTTTVTEIVSKELIKRKVEQTNQHSLFANSSDKEKITEEFWETWREITHHFGKEHYLQPLKQAQILMTTIIVMVNIITNEDMNNSKKQNITTYFPKLYQLVTNYEQYLNQLLIIIVNNNINGFQALNQCAYPLPLLWPEIELTLTFLQIIKSDDLLPGEKITVHELINDFQCLLQQDTKKWSFFYDKATEDENLFPLNPLWCIPNYKKQRQSCNNNFATMIDIKNSCWQKLAMITKNYQPLSANIPSNCKNDTIAKLEQELCQLSFCRAPVATINTNDTKTSIFQSQEEENNHCLPSFNAIKKELSSSTHHYYPNDPMITNSFAHTTNQHSLTLS